MKWFYQQLLPNSRNCQGMTLVECIVAIVISGILIGSILKVYLNYSASTTTMQGKSVAQKDMVILNHFIEKDIRMAGLNIPGNGVYIDRSDPKHQVLRVFYSDSAKSTKLTKASPNGTKLLYVEDPCDVDEKYWVMYFKSMDSLDMEYFPVNRVGLRKNGATCDTILLDVNLSRTWDSAKVVYFARCIEYKTKGLGQVQELIRDKNDKQYKILPYVELFSIIPRTAKGDTVNYKYQSARTLSILVGMRSSLKGKDTNLIFNDCMASIRNYN